MCFFLGEKIEQGSKSDIRSVDEPAIMILWYLNLTYPCTWPITELSKVSTLNSTVMSPQQQKCCSYKNRNANSNCRICFISNYLVFTLFAISLKFECLNRGSDKIEALQLWFSSLFKRLQSNTKPAALGYTAKFVLADWCKDTSSLNLFITILHLPASFVQYQFVSTAAKRSSVNVTLSA